MLILRLDTRELSGVTCPQQQAQQLVTAVPRAPVTAHSYLLGLYSVADQPTLSSPKTPTCVSGTFPAQAVRATYSLGTPKAKPTALLRSHPAQPVTGIPSQVPKFRHSLELNSTLYVKCVYVVPPPTTTLDCKASFFNSRSPGAKMPPVTGSTGVHLKAGREAWLPWASSRTHQVCIFLFQSCATPTR